MYRTFIESSLQEAALIANDMFGKVTQTEKGTDNNQILTEADIAIGNLLVTRVLEQYPEHSIIDEEAGVTDNNSDFVWVIDPIDGTSNFANGLPHYGCMIGLLYKGQPIAGGVVLPAFNELYSAEKDAGATCNGNPISVSQEHSLLASLVAYGIDGHQENPDSTKKEMKDLGNIVLAIRNLRTSNSAADIMFTASGKYGIFMNKTSKIWDNVAPQIIMEEAGGIYTDYYGQPVDYSNALNRTEQNFTCCGGAKILHAQIQSILQR